MFYNRRNVCVTRGNRSEPFVYTAYPLGYNTITNGRNKLCGQGTRIMSESDFSIARTPRVVYPIRLITAHTGPDPAPQRPLTARLTRDFPKSLVS